MARDNDASGTSQSKRLSLNGLDSDSQLSAQLVEQEQTQLQLAQQTHRPKHQKHVVGGGRLHARVPSSKALHKHHATTSVSKLTRRATSPSPERRPTNTHRRSTSDVKLARDPSSSNLKKNSSHTHLPRNRSSPSIGKKSKSSSNLAHSRSSSVSTQSKRNSQVVSKVHFDIGDDDTEDAPQEDEWVDASNSASPHLSRRGSVANSHTLSSNLADRHDTRPDRGAEPDGPSEPHPDHVDQPQDTAHSLTKRILHRIPSQGAVAPPQMFTDSVSARPPSSHQPSPESRGSNDAVQPNPRRAGANGEVRPGSSGREHLTSRFVGNNSQISEGSFSNNARLARVANGKADGGPPRRPRSMVNLGQARGDSKIASASDDKNNNNNNDSSNRESDLTDEEDGGGLVSGHARRGSGFPRELNRTQQKLNLQRASSTLETPRAHTMSLAGVPVAANPMLGGGGYGPGDARSGKMLERTGMEYLVVRRYQNPVARSIARLHQLPGANKNRPIPRPGTAHSRADSSYTGRPSSINGDPRDPHVAALMNAHGGHNPRRSMSTPRVNGTSAYGAEGLQDGQRLSGSSLVDGEEDAGTVALLRNMWDKSMDLSASQD